MGRPSLKTIPPIGAANEKQVCFNISRYVKDICNTDQFMKQNRIQFIMNGYVITVLFGGSFVGNVVENLYP